MTNIADPDQTAPRSSLIRVYTVCHSICIFWTYYCVVKPKIHFRRNTVIVSGVPIFIISTVLAPGNIAQMLEHMCTVKTKIVSTKCDQGRPVLEFPKDLKITHKQMILIRLYGRQAFVSRYLLLFAGIFALTFPMIAISSWLFDFRSHHYAYEVRRPFCLLFGFGA